MSGVHDGNTSGNGATQNKRRFVMLCVDHNIIFFFFLVIFIERSNLILLFFFLLFFSFCWTKKKIITTLIHDSGRHDKITGAQLLLYKVWLGSSTLGVSCIEDSHAGIIQSKKLYYSRKVCRSFILHHHLLTPWLFFFICWLFNWEI